MNNIIQKLVYSVFGVTEPALKTEELDIATGGKDISYLESEKDAAKTQKMLSSSKIPTPSKKEPPKDVKKKTTTGKVLKIMTPSQLITRLPILLARVKADNNSQKLKNEIRQIIYSLYRSKNLSETIYNHLINSI